MQTLEEISEAAAARCEQIVRDSQAMDYAYLQDIEALKRGESATHLRQFINSKHAELIDGSRADSQAE